MTKDATSAPVNLEIYQLDVYRLLTLLLADKTIAKNKQFNPLGERYTEGEANRLLVLVSVFSRQLMDDEKADNKKFGGEVCGQYRPQGGQNKPLSFRSACNQVIHAKEIVLYQLPSQENDIKYFNGVITIRSLDKQSSVIVSELDLLVFAGICVKIASSSDLTTTGGNHANISHRL